MNYETRRSQLNSIFSDIDQNERDLIDPLLDEVAYLEVRMTDLKKLPMISVHPTKPDHQKVTAASRQYKECSQSYMNAVRILVGVLHRVDTSAQDDLLRRLEEFT